LTLFFAELLIFCLGKVAIVVGLFGHTPELTHVGFVFLMKQVIFKVFAVFITVVAVAMMGASLATFFVHPDVRAEMNTPAMQNYTFEEQPGEKPQWSVARRFSTDPTKPADRVSVGTFPSPYEALIKAHGDLKNYLTQQAGTMSTDKATADEQTKLFAATQEQDVVAIDQRAAQLKVGVDQLALNLQNRSKELTDLSEVSRKTREETASRRTDVLRLRHELEEARTDLFRLTTVRRDLMDRLVRLQIENQELTDRQAQVEGKSAAAADYQNDPVQ
jgi:hypothetical protein